ncbi:hypothetical protein DEDE109153_05840 [Deinococcus deserti]
MPHSREWYARLARELGGYRLPWTRVLSGPDPELTFDQKAQCHRKWTEVGVVKRTAIPKAQLHI